MSALAVTGSLKISTSVTETLTNGLGTGTFTMAAPLTLPFKNGSGANSIVSNIAFTKTAAASTPDSYTLSAMIDGLGRTIVFTIIRALVLINNNTVDGQNLFIGGSAGQAWPGPFDDLTATLKVGANGCLVLGNPLGTGYPVTVGDLLKINPGSNAISYTLHIFGE